MLKLIRKILLLVVFSSFLHSKGFAQIGLNAQPVGLTMNDSKATVSEGDSILKYFIKQSDQFYSYSTDGRTLTLRDSIFPIIKYGVESLLKGYNKEVKFDIDTLAGLFAVIYKRIMSIQATVPSQRSIEELKEISDTISAFPSSIAKVLLVLSYQNLTVQPRMTFNSVSLLFAKASAEANLINNVFKKGKAFLDIGDYFSDRDIIYFPLEAYYWAQMYFYACDKDSLTKYYFQGIACEKLAMSFPDTNSEIANGIQKQSDYYITATNFFNHAKKIEEADQAFSKYLSNYAYLSIPFEGSKFSSGQCKVMEANVLHYLGDSYIKEIKTQKDIGDKFRLLNNIGNVLKTEHKYEEAKSFFLYALTSCIGKSDLDNISGCLYNVSLVYALLKKKSLALNYSQLSITIATRINNRIAYANAVLNKATVFLILKQYDSALMYTNKIYYTVKLHSREYSPSETQIGVLACRLKLKTLEALKSDSVLIYKTEYNELTKKQLDDFVYLLLSENDIKAGSIKSVKEWEVSTEKYQRELVETLNAKISTRNLQLTGTAIALSAFSIFIVILVFRNKKTAKKLLHTSTSDLRLRSAIKNHNLKNHYSKIKLMLLDDRIPEALNYCNANSKYFTPYYEALLKDKVSLQEEIEIFKSFINTENIYKKKVIRINYIFKNITPKNTKFLCDILTPLYENVLMKGFTTERNDYSFTIELKKVGNRLKGRIYDNGEGNANIQSEIRENSYLDMLRTRLHNYFELKNIKVDKEEVFQINSTPGIGTEIKIMMPYETL